jgi:hypothetical protein
VVSDPDSGGKSNDNKNKNITNNKRFGGRIPYPAVLLSGPYLFTFK